MKEIKVTFQTLTPLWTGDAWRRSDDLKLTGIIGSLRWWFEALVRGMGYKACDSTGDNSCKVEVKNPEDVLEIHKEICPVCYLFGTTGWKSRFSVEIEENNLSKPYNEKVVIRIDGNRGWHYEPGLMGNAVLKIRFNEAFLKKEDKEIRLTEVAPSILKILLYLIQEYGMLGAKTAMGYGVVKFRINEKELTISEDDWNNFVNYLDFFSKFRGNIIHLPNLKDMFFVNFNVIKPIDEIINKIKTFYSYQDGAIETDEITKWKDKGWCITSPVMRKCLRCIFRGKYSNQVCWINRDCDRNYWWNYYGENNSKNKANRSYNSNLTIDRLNVNYDIAKKIRHFLMGSTSEPEFSAIQVSHMNKKDQDNFEFRVYGWLPNIPPIDGRVNDIIALLNTLFMNVPWRKRFGRENGRNQEIDLLPSSIQNNLCWNGNSIRKIGDENRIRQLFNVQEDLGL